MQGIRKLLGATALALSFLATAPGATAATQLFEFKNDSETVAFGTFSFADGLTNLTSFAQLTAFNISINVPATFQDGLPRIFTFSKADVTAMPATVPGGFHFGYDVITNKFVSTVDAALPALPYFGGGNAHATMAAFSSAPDGFLIDWRAPDALSADSSGIMAMATLPGGDSYSGVVGWNSYAISAVSPVSEPSSMAMAVAGLGIVGCVALRRRRT